MLLSYNGTRNAQTNETNAGGNRRRARVFYDTPFGVIFVMEMNSLLARGIEQFNKGEFFECHDTFEELWNELSGGEKVFVQGLIQSAVGCYHALNGNFRGAYSQFGKSLEKLTLGAPESMGFDATAFNEFIGGIRICRTLAGRKLNGEPAEFSLETIPHMPD